MSDLVIVKTDKEILFQFIMFTLKHGINPTLGFSLLS